MWRGRLQDGLVGKFRDGGGRVEGMRIGGAVEDEIERHDCSK